MFTLHTRRKKHVPEDDLSTRIAAAQNPDVEAEKLEQLWPGTTWTEHDRGEKDSNELLAKLALVLVTHPCASKQLLLRLRTSAPTVKIAFLATERLAGHPDPLQIWHTAAKMAVGTLGGRKQAEQG